MATKKTYDLALFRLSKILTMLSNNERPTMLDLKEEFGVSLRTIQTDIYNRLSSYPIEKDSLKRLKFSDGFSINKSILESNEMILVSLALSSFKDSGEFDKTSESVIQKLIYPNLFNPYYIKKTSYESLDTQSRVVKLLKVAIEDKNIITVSLNKVIIDVEPYKIASFDGFWYLFAKDIKAEKIKTFILSKIEDVVIKDTHHKTNLSNLQQVLDSTHSAWFDDGETFEVIIEVYSEISQYFLKRNFLQSQEIVDTKDDGTLIIKFEITHYEDIDNLVKSWLPHIKVISPKSFSDKIKKELEGYLLTY